MDRQWYLLRDGQVFGPVTDAQLAQSAAAGRVFPTDQLNVAGQPDWFAASAVPGLLPTPEPEPVLLQAAPDPIPLDLEPEPLSLEPVIADLMPLEPEIADLMPAEPEIADLLPVETVPLRTIRVTCFVCYSEVSVGAAAIAPCPRCGAAIVTGELADTAPTTSANQAAFATLESPDAFKERMQRKVAAAETAAARDGAILGAVARGVVG